MRFAKLSISAFLLLFTLVACFGHGQNSADDTVMTLTVKSSSDQEMNVLLKYALDGRKEEMKSEVRKTPFVLKCDKRFLRTSLTAADVDEPVYAEIHTLNDKGEFRKTVAGQGYLLLIESLGSDASHYSLEARKFTTSNSE
ncbi:MAG: hypothetical protein GF372_07115 [Candidatus Marinimicrobia bacterium]|nr:hypothetical protein [Candidatus Neomarinimicrobiota bacterium]